MLRILSILGVAVFVGLCSGNPVNTTVDNTSLTNKFRLNHDFEPTKYVLKLTLEKNFAAEKEFTGSVDVDVVRKTANATTLRMHRDNRMSAFKITSGVRKVKQRKYDKETEIMEIMWEDVAEVVEGGEKGKLHFEYKGVLYEDMYGFYLSELNNGAYIATTQFQPAYARRAFPCFDEPSFKATFEISLVTPNNYVVLSNQPESDQTENAKWKTTTFQPTPAMSTYLVAFVVFEDSNFIDTQVGETNNMNIWSPSELESNALYASEISHKILNNIGKMLMPTGGNQTIGFDQMGIEHLEQVAIPDFAAGAMENWGLVTYRETALLYDEIESKMKDKERVASVIAHEFAHNWFGNWVTLNWWNNTWLNEGFATYFESHALVDISETKNFEKEKQFVLEDVHSTMETDGKIGAMPLQSDANTVSEIKAKFGTISYGKGGSIVRMMEKMVTKDVFLKNLNTYISNNKGKNTGPEHLFDTFEDIDDVKFGDIMKNWIEKSGYPVITVTLNGGKVTVTQKEFSYGKIDGDGTKWFVPITSKVITMSNPSTTEVPGSSTTQNPSSSTTTTIPTTTTTKGPTTTTTEIPTTTTTEVPTTPTSEVPSTTILEVPSTDTTEVPTIITSEVPSTTITEVPSTDTTEVPTITTTEVFSATITEVPSTYTLETNTATQDMIRRSKRDTFNQNLILLKPDAEEPIEVHSGLKDNELIIVNPENAGYYRVNYDEQLWARIIEELKNNHESINPIIRAQLINDAMNLARSGDLKNEVSMELLKYLEHETNYYPWKAALTGFSYLRKRLVGDSLRNDITNTMNLQMEKFYQANKDFETDKDTMTPIKIYARILALEWKCELDGDECVEKAKKLFDEHINLPKTRADDTPLDANIRSIVYCSALRHSEGGQDQTNWDKLWKKYNSAEVVNEKVTILTALGCTKNTTILNAYLEKSITDPAIRKQDASAVFKAVLAGNPEGVDVSLDFLNNNFTEIAAHYGSMGALSSVIVQVADRITTSDQLTKFETFVSEHDGELQEAATVAQNAINSAKANIEWATTYKQELQEYYNGNDDGGASGVMSTSMVGLLLIALIVRFF